MKTLRLHQKFLDGGDLLSDSPGYIIPVGTVVRDTSGSAALYLGDGETTFDQMVPFVASVEGTLDPNAFGPGDSGDK